MSEQENALLWLCKETGHTSEWLKLHSHSGEAISQSLVCHMLLATLSQRREQKFPVYKGHKSFLFTREQS